MTEAKVPYEYFVLRAVPRVERGEFVNVGVVLYSHAAEFLGARSAVPVERLLALDPGVDFDGVRAALRTIEAICRGDVSAGEAASGSLRARFGWLAAPRSTVLQPGPVHGGITADPAATLDELLESLVR